MVAVPGEDYYIFDSLLHGGGKVEVEIDEDMI